MNNVSILTPLTNQRLKFLVIMIQNVSNQDYPHNLIEWVVVGDEIDETRLAFENAFKQIDVKCKYISCGIMNDIGKKRNFCVKNASHKILANMDSDDLYMKTFLSYSINELKTRNKGIVGCRDLMILFPQYEQVNYVKGTSIHEGTSVFTFNHWKTIKYKEKVICAEGSNMSKINYYNELDIRKIMICVSHGNNTYDKKKFMSYPEVKFPKEKLKELSILLSR